MTEAMHQAPQGVFITFEGGEGAGKSTHIKFLASCLHDRGREVLCLREPGGTKVGEQLRQVVLNPENGAVSPQAELLIYEAARAQIVAEVIKPALERGAVVLCDRFADSTIAYQGYGRHLPKAFIDAASDFACQGIRPHRTILMTTGGTAAQGLTRATHHGAADRLEQEPEEFHAAVNAGFMTLAKEHPDRIRVVVSDGPKSQTAASIFFELADLFPWMGDASVCSEDYFAVLDVKREHLGRTGLDDAVPGA